MDQSSRAYLHLAKWPWALRHSCGLAAGHLMKWPLALRQTFGLTTGHLMNLPLASLHGAASDGAEPATRLSAVNANTNFFMSFLPRHLGAWENRRSHPSCRCPQHYNGLMARGGHR